MRVEVEYLMEEEVLLEEEARGFGVKRFSWEVTCGERRLGSDRVGQGTGRACCPVTRSVEIESP